MSLVDVHLAEKIAKNVAKCIKMFGVKMENHSISGPEASQIIGLFLSKTFFVFCCKWLK